VTEQVVKVRSDETDGDETGRHWTVHYILFHDQDDDGRDCYDLYTDDGAGNGKMICRGYNKNTMVSLTLRLGEFVAWKE
jgi:hypothetical protein